MFMLKIEDKRDVLSYYKIYAHGIHKSAIVALIAHKESLTMEDSEIKASRLLKEGMVPTEWLNY